MCARRRTLALGVYSVVYSQQLVGRAVQYLCVDLGFVAIVKAVRNRRQFDTFDKAFIDRHCQSSVVDWLVKVSLSARRCRVQVCNP
jgi:hypothetical protein